MKTVLFRIALVSLATTLCVACATSEPEQSLEKPVTSNTAAEAKPAETKPTPPEESPAERVRRVHFGATVWDTHADTLGRMLEDGVDIGVRLDDGHIDLIRMKEGGLDVQVFAAWVEPGYWPDKAKDRAVKMIDTLHATVAKYPDRMGFAPTVKDARRLVSEGKVAALLGIEGGHAIEDDLGALEMFYKKGVRYMTLTWWNNTNWADGSGDEPKWNGLNDLGRKVVKEMNRLGMIVDVSHASEDTFWDVLEIATKPVIVSHSNTRALNDHHRNLTDKQLKALAKNGGVIGINFVAGFLDQEFLRAYKKMKQKLKPDTDAIMAKYKKDPMRGRKERWKFLEKKAAELLPPVPLERVIEHIDHAVKVAGIDHVGIGSDFDGFTIGARELKDCTKLPLITEKLLARGYSEEDVTKILGGNFLRVFEENIGQ
ncbi:MAG: membrane dipeptidase [Deltaproteobacteria bacterium]|nr:membrane dipeptidase [Deltaproteobacteria bacterium]